MKIVVLIARVLLGLVFLVFGLNGFLHFIPGGPPPGLAGQFSTAMMQSHFSYLVFAAQLFGGILLLINRYVPLALTVLAAVIANILMFHITMAPADIGPGLLTAIFWLIVFYSVRESFAPLFASRPAVRL